MMRALLALVAVLVLAGCGSDPEESADVPTSIEPAATPSSSAGTGGLQIRRIADPATAPEAERAAYTVATCPEVAPTPAEAADIDITCNEQGEKFLLAPAAYEGWPAEVSAAVPQNATAWAVLIGLDETGTAAFTRLTRELYDDGGEMALVLDGRLLSYAGINEPITTGDLQITGDFTEKTANELVDQLTR